VGEVMAVVQVKMEQTEKDVHGVAVLTTQQMNVFTSCEIHKVQQATPRRRK